MNGHTGIGQRLKALRAVAGLSLQEMAEQTGLSVPYLSRVENEKANISIINLRQIANALEVPLASLFLDEIEASIQLSRKEERRAMILNVCEGKKCTEEWLLTDPKSKLEPALIRLPVGTNGGKPFGHEGWEFIWVLKGEIHYTVGASEFDLHEGDTLYYQAILPHYFRNDGKKTAEFLVVATPWNF
jgi:transcriptional regulator with XRE-family HTH domain